MYVAYSLLNVIQSVFKDVLEAVDDFVDILFHKRLGTGPQYVMQLFVVYPSNVLVTSSSEVEDDL